MRIGINASNLVVAGATVDDYVAHAVAAEQDGFSSWWMAQLGSPDALTVLGAVGRAHVDHRAGHRGRAHLVPAPADAGGPGAHHAGDGGRPPGARHRPRPQGADRGDPAHPVRRGRRPTCPTTCRCCCPPSPTGRWTSPATSGRASPTASAAPRRGGPVGPGRRHGAADARARGRAGPTAPCCGSAGRAPSTSTCAPPSPPRPTEAGRPEPRIVASVPLCVTDEADQVRGSIAALLAGYNDLPSYRGVMDREGVDGPAGVSIVGDEDEVRKRGPALRRRGHHRLRAGRGGDEPRRGRPHPRPARRARQGRMTAVSP